MRERVQALLAQMAVAGTSADRLAANATLIGLLDDFLLNNTQWNGGSALNLPTLPAPSTVRANFDSGGLVDLPVLPAIFIGTTFFLTKLEITNQGSGEVVISVWDGNGDFLIPARALPKGEIATYTAPDGRRMNGGIHWVGSAAGCKCYLRGYPA